jgi:hypothetical protein
MTQRPPGRLQGEQFLKRWNKTKIMSMDCDVRIKLSHLHRIG